MVLKLSELSCMLPELFNMCWKEYCFSDGWKFSSVVPVLGMFGRGLQLKTTVVANLLSILKSLTNLLISSKNVAFFYFKHGFRSSHSTINLLTAASDKTGRAFSRSRDTQAVALDTSKAFDRVLVFFTNSRLMDFQVRYLALYSVFSQQ